MAQKLHQLYAPTDPQSRRRMGNTAMVIGIIAFVLATIELVVRLI